MKITKWKIVTIMEIDELGIVSYNTLKPIQIIEEDDEDTEDEE